MRSDYEIALDIEKEQQAIKKFKELANLLANASVSVWHFGDGHGGFVRLYIDECFTNFGLFNEKQHNKKFGKVYSKKPISNKLRTMVFERDKYRCVSCGTHIDLCIDHIYPECKGGQANIENLQTLCRPCNTKKGSKFPFEGNT